MTDGNTKIHCNGCGQRTWHTKNAEHILQRTHEPNRDIEVELQYGYEIWTCLGCDNTSFREWMSIDGEFMTEAFYPERTLGLIRPKKFQKLGEKLKKIYREIIDAFNSGSHILCASGLRILVEGICNDKHMVGTSLADRIDNLAPRWVSKLVVKNLHSFRFLGNEALHELRTPERDHLALAIEVVEDVMNAIYELDYKSGRLMQWLDERKQVSDKAEATAQHPKAKTKPDAK